jgi:hypothetical protein
MQLIQAFSRLVHELLLSILSMSDMIGLAMPIMPVTMKKYLLAISLVFALVVSVTRAGTPDPRFEGVWVGPETYTAYYSVSQQGTFEPVHMTALIAIGPGGKTFGVLQGLGPGRYDVSSKSDGSKLMFKSTLSGTGRNNCTFVLSADGNTLTETGFGLLPAKPYAITCNITGTLHRKSKK